MNQETWKALFAGDIPERPTREIQYLWKLTEPKMIRPPGQVYTLSSFGTSFMRILFDTMAAYAAIPHMYIWFESIHYLETTIRVQGRWTNSMYVERQVDLMVYQIELMSILGPLRLFAPSTPIRNIKR